MQGLAFKEQLDAIYLFLFIGLTNTLILLINPNLTHSLNIHRRLLFCEK